MWEIQDNNGTIESVSEEEMRELWYNTVQSGKSPRITNWKGDLRLVQAQLREYNGTFLTLSEIIKYIDE